jgi:hypothetical protein
MGLSACNVTAPPSKDHVDMPTTAFLAKGYVNTSTVGATRTLFVSPTGDDSASGTDAQHPFRTLVKARDVLRALALSDRAGAVVNLLGGTYYLKDTLVLTAEDSGELGKPVTWQAYPSGAKVAVSGGVPISCAWKPVTLPTGVAAQSCDVPVGTSFTRLFVGGLRRTSARFPNGDMLKPKDGYSGGAKPSGENFPVTAQRACDPNGANVNFLATDGSTISTGCVAFQPEGWSRNVTVVDRSIPRAVTTTKDVYVNSSRYNSTFNLPIRTPTCPSSIHIPEDWAARKWAQEDLKGATVKMLHPQGWGSWAFEVADAPLAGDVMSFAKGGFQEARGNTGTGAAYIENIFKELDATEEWYLNEATHTLYYIPAANDRFTSTAAAASIVEGTNLKQLIEFRGSVDSPASYISLIGFNISRTAPTFLDSHEMPSGGDWSIHRGAAVFLDGAFGVTLERLVFDQVGGNAVMLSNYAWNNSVLNCDFWRTGDTAVAAVGSTNGVDGTSATYPAFNSITGNHFDTVGVETKQTSCYFKAKAHANVVSNNICHDGPRAGINFNDGFMGGEVLHQNVIWAMVKETGDHGTFNSWDRNEFFYNCTDDQASTPGAKCFMPNTHDVGGNMFIGPAGWNMDHDDGSSDYADHDNIVYLGGFKYRDGINRNMTGNVMLGGAKPAFQVTGFDTNIFNGNVLDSSGPTCGPAGTKSIANNIYILVSGSNTGLSDIKGYNATFSPVFSSTRDSVCDKGTTKTMTVAEVTALVASKVGMVTL